jgi:hypothetical protein
VWFENNRSQYEYVYDADGKIISRTDYSSNFGGNLTEIGTSQYYYNCTEVLKASAPARIKQQSIQSVEKINMEREIRPLQHIDHNKRL